MVNVFISYAKNDSAIAERLSKALSEEGIEVWLDKNSIRPGDLWINEISRAIQNADVFMPMISDSYSKSNFLSSEIAAAIAAKSNDPTKKIIPILLDSNARLPSFIDQYQFLDISSTPDLSSAVSHLKEIIFREGHRERSTLDVQAVQAGRDIQFTALEYEKRAFEARETIRNKYLRYAALLSLVTTLLGFSVASALVLYGLEKGQGVNGALTTILSATTGFLGVTIGYYFGRNSRDASKTDHSEVSK